MPLCKSLPSEYTFFIFMFILLLLRKLIKYLRILEPNRHLISSSTILWIPILSYAFSKSKLIIDKCLLVDRAALVWWSSSARHSDIDIPFRKPSWRLSRSLQLVANHHSLDATILSKTFAMHGFKVMGRYELTAVFTEFGLWMGMTVLFLNCCGWIGLSVFELQDLIGSLTLDMIFYRGQEFYLWGNLTHWRTL